MSMTSRQDFHDALSRWAEVSDGKAAQLVRITEHDSGNRYRARPTEFDAMGGTTVVGQTVLTVTNLAEPADAGGQVPPATDAVALDVCGRWVVFLRPAVEGFPARVLASEGQAAYTVRPQVAAGPGEFADAPGADDLTAHNLAELSLGPGAAVEAGAIVLLTVLTQDGAPPVKRYVFDHPAYAKYLD